MAKSTFTSEQFKADRRHVQRMNRAERPPSPEELEHTLGSMSLVAYLEPVGEQRYLVSSAKHPRTRETHSETEIRKQATLIKERVSKAKLEHPLVNALPVSRGKEFAQFHLPSTLNIWDYEPQLIDDLNRAKKLGDNEAINYLRGINRAGSWTSHERVNEKDALAIAKQWLANLLAKQPKSPKREAVETLVTLLTQNICGKEAESSVEFIERQLEEKWVAFCKEFAQASRDAKNPPRWPERVSFYGEKQDARFISEKDHPELAMLQKQIITLRKLRDQATYHLLNKTFCEFIKQPPSKH